MAVANGTRVAVPDGWRLIEDLAKGDQVLASGSPLQWTPDAVALSAGANGEQAVMVYVRWGEGQEIIASQDHVFVRADLSLCLADRLTPGESLLTSDGAGAEIQAVAVGHFSGGIHEIATATPWTPGSLAGRLLNTGGVVTGDYQLQIHFRPGAEPEIGTVAYEESHTTVRNL